DERRGGARRQGPRGRGAGGLQHRHRPFLPGAPRGARPEVAALRAGFQKMLKDAKFRSEVERLGGEVKPLDGAQLAKLVAETLAAPDDVADLARKVSSVQGKKKK